MTTKLEAAAQRYADVKKRIDANFAAQKHLREQIDHLKRECNALGQEEYKLQEEWSKAVDDLHKAALDDAR